MPQCRRDAEAGEFPLRARESCTEELTEGVPDAPISSEKAIRLKARRNCPAGAQDVSPAGAGAKQGERAV